MQEVGIDLSRATPRLLTPDLARRAARLVTMGCGEECPVVPGLAREDWPFADPKGRTLSEVRSVRDAIRDRVMRLLADRDWLASSGAPRSPSRRHREIPSS